MSPLVSPALKGRHGSRGGEGQEVDSGRATSLSSRLPVIGIVPSTAWVLEEP